MNSSNTETRSQLAKLKNGSQEFMPLVATTMMALRSLNPVLLYELLQKCRNRHHEFWGNSAQPLKDLALVQPSGDIHSSIRNIVLSAVVEENNDLSLVSPIAAS